MGKDGLVRLPRIDESLRDEFKQDVEDRFGGVKGHYRHEVENALREYLKGSKGGDTHDRLRRLENTVERIDERTEALVDGDAPKNKKDSTVSEVGTKTENRLSEMRGIIERESGKGPVHEAVVRQAIEDVAGHSDPTIRRYKQMLTDRNILHPHPKSTSKFVYGDDAFVVMIQDMASNGALGNDRYWEFVDGFGGEDAWRDTLESTNWGDGDEEAGRGFA
jgi:hypothetical protein